MCKGGCKGKCGCNITSTTKGEKGDPSSEIALGYKVYIALLEQVGTDAPTATILQNTLDEHIAFDYVTVGEYNITSPNAFTADKTFVSLRGINDNGDIENSGLGDTFTLDSNNINIFTYKRSTLAKANDCLLKSSLEIRVYN